MEDEEGVFWPKEGSYGASNKSAIMKGKRTKRQPLQCPFQFDVNNVSDGDQGCDWEKDGGVKFSSERIEEEDMARCLILLAQGRSRDFRKEEVDYRRCPNYDWRELLDREDQKFNSKRYLEAGVGTTAGKIGYYVYECKTCYRAFPSFQALGGHRASHYKKPKAAAVEENKQIVPPLSMINKGDDEAPVARFTRDGNGGMPSSVLYLQLSSSRNLCGARGKYKDNNNPKVHECRICGVDFSSGQALGGHMRRHRPPTSTSLGFSSTQVTPTDSGGPPMRVRSLESLDLDLNLPAPEAAVDLYDIHEENNSAPIAAAQPKQQQGQQDQPRLMFSVPALVDCHY